MLWGQAQLGHLSQCTVPGPLWTKAGCPENRCLRQAPDDSGALKLSTTQPRRLSPAREAVSPAQAHLGHCGDPGLGSPFGVQSLGGIWNAHILFKGAGPSGFCHLGPRHYSQSLCVTANRKLPYANLPPQPSRATIRSAASFCSPRVTGWLRAHGIQTLGIC